MIMEPLPELVEMDVQKANLLCYIEALEAPENQRRQIFSNFKDLHGGVCALALFSEMFDGDFRDEFGVQLKVDGRTLGEVNDSGMTFRQIGQYLRKHYLGAPISKYEGKE